MITEGNAEFPRDPRRIIDYPAALASTLGPGSGTMVYAEGAARIGLLEPIFSPLQSLIPRFQEEVMQINLTGIFNFPRESVSPEEAKNQRSYRDDFQSTSRLLGAAKRADQKPARVV